MKFQRTAKIFRGQLDFVPLANVAFLLLFFVLLTSLIYTPGIPFQLEEKLKNLIPHKKLVINKAGEVLFETNVFKIDEMEKLGDEFKKLPINCIVSIKADKDAPKEVQLQVQKQTRNLPIIVQKEDEGIELPTAENVTGTANPTVMVAVNFGRQIFYENQIITTTELRQKLEAAVRAAREPLTLVVLADKSVENDTLVQLGILARDAGIREMLLAAKPAMP